MAAEAAYWGGTDWGGHVFFNGLQMLLLWGRGRRLSRKFCRSLCWQTDVADYRSSSSSASLQRQHSQLAESQKATLQVR